MQSLHNSSIFFWGFETQKMNSISTNSNSLQKRKRDERDETIPANNKRRKIEFLEFHEMTFRQRVEYYACLNWLAKHPTEAEIIISIIRKEQSIAQRIIEHVTTFYARRYNLVLENDSFNVRERFKAKLNGSRKDPNCRGPRIKIVYKNKIVVTTLEQLACLIFVVSTPVYQYIVDNYDLIKNDLNYRRDLVPTKKDISNIKRPQKQPPTRAAYWRTAQQVLGG